MPLADRLAALSYPLHVSSLKSTLPGPDLSAQPVYWETQKQQFCFVHSLNACAGKPWLDPLAVLDTLNTAARRLRAACTPLRLSGRLHMDPLAELDLHYRRGCGNFDTIAMNYYLHKSGQPMHLQVAQNTPLTESQAAAWVSASPLPGVILITPRHGVALVRKLNAWWLIDSMNHAGPYCLQAEDWVHLRPMQVVLMRPGAPPSDHLPWQLTCVDEPDGGHSTLLQRCGVALAAPANHLHAHGTQLHVVQPHPPPPPTAQQDTQPTRTVQGAPSPALNPQLSSLPRPAAVKQAPAGINTTDFPAGHDNTGKRRQRIPPAHEQAGAQQPSAQRPAKRATKAWGGRQLTLADCALQPAPTHPPAAATQQPTPAAGPAHTMAHRRRIPFSVAALNVRGYVTNGLCVEEALREHSPTIIVLTEHKLMPKTGTARTACHELSKIGTLGGYTCHATCSPPASEGHGRRGVLIGAQSRHGAFVRAHDTPPALKGCLVHARLEGSGDETPLHVIGVYAPCTNTLLEDERTLLQEIYAYITRVAEHCKDSKHELIVAGDFNAAWYANDRSTGTLTPRDKQHWRLCRPSEPKAPKLRPLVPYNPRRHTYSGQGATSSRIDDILVLENSQISAFEETHTIANLDHKLLVGQCVGDIPGLQPPAPELPPTTSLIIPIAKADLQATVAKWSSMLEPKTHALRDRLRSLLQHAEDHMQGTHTASHVVLARAALQSQGVDINALGAELDTTLAEALHIMMATCATKTHARSGTHQAWSQQEAKTSHAGQSSCALAYETD